MQNPRQLTRIFSISRTFDEDSCRAANQRRGLIPRFHARKTDTLSPEEAACAFSYSISVLPSSANFSWIKHQVTELAFIRVLGVFEIEYEKPQPIKSKGAISRSAERDPARDARQTGLSRAHSGSSATRAPRLRANPAPSAAHPRLRPRPLDMRLHIQTHVRWI